MKSEREIGESVTTTNQPPFLYEIRVKGRLSGEQWTSWFDDLTVSFAQGESTLRGKVPDHAALYGLLARLRDLAIPLVEVRVLDAETQHNLAQTSRRYALMINGLLVALYLLLGGLATITVFVAPVINVALALTLLFALLGALAPGMAADFIAYRPERLDFAGTLHDPLAALVFCTPPKVDLSVIDGKARVKDGEIVGLDMPALVRRHDAISRKMLRGE